VTAGVGPGRREAGAVALLALLALLRVGAFASALPFFHVNDEHHHVDTVVRYARGELPGPRAETLSPQVARWAMRWGTFAYLNPGPDVPPPYLQRGLPPEAPEMRRAYQAYDGVAATELESPPVYYAVAALWYRLGKAAGQEDLDLLYWLRWLDAPLLAALVVGSWLVLRRPYAGDPLMRLGVPAVLAFFPADVLLVASPDALSPLVGGASLAAVAWLARAKAEAPFRAVLGGGALALAFLTKYTNIVYVLLAAGVGIARLRGPKPPLRLLALLWTAAALPVALWLGRNLVVLGDLTGTARKLAALEWSRRPVGELLDHPLFGLEGLTSFLTRLPILFWRGELPWHGETMAHAWLDPLYAGTSLVFVTLALWALHRPGVPERRRLEALAVAAVLAATALLAALSLSIEFASWGTPTRDDPFFVHGRLISGVLAPFALVWVRGLQVLLTPLPGRAGRLAPGAALVAWLVAITASEAVLLAPVFASPWNWYHAGG